MTNRPGGGEYKPRFTRFRRQSKRSSLLYYLPIQDADSGARLGLLADLSPGGLLMLGEQPHRTGERLRLRLEGPADSELTEGLALSVDAEVRWSAPDVNPAYHATGVRFLNVDEQAQARIEALLTRLGMAGEAPE
ncbi:PilZ domain-containing protein [Halorhodospira neutriphila]|uniref:PilZ domain-containing protein n=1 Tax=Halorhodospira neutriphila TaxID=168379 RepID=A0ABS1E567_9GAMM|nr:PilZ domain-containing protein [Halorhodospira neutriphila]MBK1726650.1 hypothetical protein [Halorhodospira neutriphila]